MVPEDTGDALTATTDLGAATANLDELYWLPGLIGPDGRRQMMLPERHQPHSIIVDASGSRYVNEAINYMSLGCAMFKRHRVVPAVPSWLILDSRHRRRYPLGFVPPRVVPRRWLASGHLRRADTLELLAGECGVDAEGLRRTVDRLNVMAMRGVDGDFHRGDSAYDRVYGARNHSESVFGYHLRAGQRDGPCLLNSTANHLGYLPLLTIAIGCLALLICTFVVVA